MSAYHQMGHDSENLLGLAELSSYAGAIASPVNYSSEKMRAQIEKFQKPNFEVIFDPQLYCPYSERGELPTWSYFPADFETADMSSKTWWEGVNSGLAKVLHELHPRAVCAPVALPKVFDDNYYLAMRDVAESLASAVSGDGIETIQTVVVDLKSVSQTKRALEIASIASGSTLERVYVVLASDVEPRREFAASDEIKGAMRLIHELSNSGMKVLMGFCSTDLLLWKAAGAHAVATGKFFNLRRFTKSRFEDPAGGGGQLPYWFEDSLAAYLREPDVLRVRKALGLSDASSRNPFSKEILQTLDTKPGSAWVALSWRQYMWSFADVEAGLTSGTVSPSALLKDAEARWKRLEDDDVLMEEARNDGKWVRPWRIALKEFAE